MVWSWRRRALVAAAHRVSRLVLAAAGAMTLAGCTFDGPPSLSAALPRGATVAFESIDGPPPTKFKKLVQNLNDEAQSRQIAVISRESPSVYRVRGYIAAKAVNDQTTISWVWDVFDGDERRALRITGEETPKGRHRDAWTAVDDAMLHRIARSSVDELASFLTSPEVASNTRAAAAEPQIALIGQHDFSPEASGIFRIFRAQADPKPPEAAEAPVAAAASADPVPLPRRKPAAAMLAREAVTLAASSQ